MLTILTKMLRIVCGAILAVSAGFLACAQSRGHAEVREVALSDAFRPWNLIRSAFGLGALLHLAGSLKRSQVQFRNIKTWLSGTFASNDCNSR